jgi:hypothetical protein
VEPHLSTPSTRLHGAYPLTSRLAFKVQAWTNDSVTENSSVCRAQVFRRPPVYSTRMRIDPLSEDLDCLSIRHDTHTIEKCKSKCNNLAPLLTIFHKK